MIDHSGITFYSDPSLLHQAVHDQHFPSEISSWNSNGSNPATKIRLDDRGTHFGYVHAGKLSLETRSGQFNLTAGMYFSVPGGATITGHSTGFAATRVGYSGFLSVGGPVEQQGRLQYIDGCSDSLLISPVVLGDPCLNLLYLPPGTEQTAHTHPSCRLGMIISGQGICRSPHGDYDLQPGMVFNIAHEAMHSFHTKDSELRVIAWHPDSDCGPAHRDHPMINRTIIDGISASQL